MFDRDSCSYRHAITNFAMEAHSSLWTTVANWDTYVVGFALVAPTGLHPSSRQITCASLLPTSRSQAKPNLSAEVGR